MRTLLSIILLLAVSAPVLAECPDFLDVDVQKLRSAESVNLCEAYGDRPLLIVNTASHCGFTPQFTELEAIHRQYKDRGLVVLGFPSNSFRQEAGTEDETAQICYVNYGVTFQMFSHVAVLGGDAHPVFKGLAEQAGVPTWNFNKYILDKNGKVVKLFGSLVKPDSEEFHKAIEGVL